jgi:hypothetical protein
MDHYEFNLDLDTWGLTTKERELARFRGWIDEEILRQSNALFGYEGDKYYFDLDIRRHFGLDKYTSDTIPYWKTETIEAMDAFRHRAGFREGAGECVSLSTLYAAALFVVCGIPLEDIFLMATPLHSQNFVAVGEGAITNNRRVVTKAMWFNGTEQSAKAQRALRHEQVTVVAHATGWIHCMYPEATIDPAAYARFQASLRRFLRTEITYEILANFLRDTSALQKCFQIQYERHGRPHFIAAERVYAYEHNSSYRVSDKTRDHLLAEIDSDEFFTERLPGRMLLNKFETFFGKGGVNLDQPDDRARLAAELECQCTRAADILGQLAAFAHLEPRFPEPAPAPAFRPSAALAITPDMDRAAIAAYLQSARGDNPVADLAFYAARDLAVTDWRPFLRAALERSPVSIAGAKDLGDDAVIAHLAGLPGESIYDGTRAALPDEVWNFGRGDGLERALCLANIWHARHPADPLRLVVRPDAAHLEFGSRHVEWPSAKGLTADQSL